MKTLYLVVLLALRATASRAQHPAWPALPTTVTTLAGTAGHKGVADGVGAAAQFDVPASIAVDSRGVLYVADYFNSVIRRITPDGFVVTFAGTIKGWSSLDGPRAEARFNFPFGVAVGANGWIYVADSGNRTIRLIK